ncbi:hypothetical protein BC832DRAFT_618325 [Gaertneriomyces semiglobifer]|nr:hypothetical protein BC832DRAFT_618325 [Gaertneriomyces semiglobifer]
MDYSDLRKIRRTLRQLCAKLDSLADAAMRPSYEHAQRQDPSSHMVKDLWEPVESLDEDVDDRTFMGFKRPNTRVTFKRKRPREIERRDTLVTRPNVVSTAPTIPSVIHHLEFTTHLPSPVRRPIISVIDLFRELIEKVWVENLDGCTHKPSRHPPTRAGRTSDPTARKPGNTVFPLAQLASFEVAKCIPQRGNIIGEDSEDLETQEAWYDAVPAHFRRYVLWSHIIQLCKEHIPIHGPYVSLVEICVSHGAYIQAWELLLHYWFLRQTPTTSDFTWSFSIATKLRKVDTWTRHVGFGLTVQQCSHLVASSIWDFLPSNEVDILKIHALRALISDDFALGSVADHGPKWLRVMAEHNAQCHISLCVCQGTLYDLSTRPIATFKPPATLHLALMLRCIQVMSRYPERFPADASIDDVINSAVDVSAGLELDSIIPFFPTFDDMSTLKDCLRACDALPLVEKLTVAMLDGYDKLRKGDSHTITPSRKQLQKELHILGKTLAGRPEAGSRWRYEPLLHTWILATPLSKRHAVDRRVEPPVSVSHITPSNAWATPPRYGAHSPVIFQNFSSPIEMYRAFKMRAVELPKKFRNRRRILESDSGSEDELVSGVANKTSSGIFARPQLDRVHGSFNCKVEILKRSVVRGSDSEDDLLTSYKAVCSPTQKRDLTGTTHRFTPLHSHSRKRCTSVNDREDIPLKQRGLRLVTSAIQTPQLVNKTLAPTIDSRGPALAPQSLNVPPSRRPRDHDFRGPVRKVHHPEHGKSVMASSDNPFLSPPLSSEGRENDELRKGRNSRLVKGLLANKRERSKSPDIVVLPKPAKLLTVKTEMDELTCTSLAGLTESTANGVYGDVAVDLQAAVRVELRAVDALPFTHELDELAI